MRQKAAPLDATLASLREKSGLLHLAQDAAGAGLFDWNLQTGMAQLSRESLALSDLPGGHRADLPAGEWISVMHPDDVPGVMRGRRRR